MDVKLINNVNPPRKTRDDDAGFDLFSPVSFVIQPRSNVRVKLGYAISLNKDEVGLIQIRSGMAYNHGLFTEGNVIDSNYRGEISMILFNSSDNPKSINQGERVCQLLVVKLGDQTLNLVDDLDETERADSGFGSSGK